MRALIDFAREDLGWGFYLLGARAGDEVRLEFERYDESEACAESDVEHAVGPIRVQAAYEPDYAHQRAYLMTPRITVSDQRTLRLVLQETDHYGP